jgi:uncharacterized protein YjbI with pentapeptide repeats
VKPVERLPGPAVTDHRDLPYAGHLTAHDGPPERGEDYDTAFWADADLVGVDATGCRFAESVLTGCTLIRGVFTRSRWHDAWLGRSRLSGLDLTESDWRDVDVVGCALTGVNLPSATLRRVRFTECKLTEVNLRATTMRGVVFDRCLLSEVDFGGADLRTVRFPGSSLRPIRLGQTRLTDVDLRGTAALTVTGDVQSLRGATIDTGQLMDLAPTLAAGLGLVVTD